MASGILQRMAEGDQTAMADCLASYGGAIWGLVRRRFANRADAEDVVQEIFAEIWKSAARFNPTVANELTFVMVLARRRIIDRQRKRAVGISTDAFPDPLDPRTSCSLEDTDEANLARDLMGKLNVDERTVLELAIDQGLTQTEISQKLDMPLGTVKTNARRGLSRLRDWLRSGREAVQGGGA